MSKTQLKGENMKASFFLYLTRVEMLKMSVSLLWGALAGYEGINFTNAKCSTVTAEGFNKGYQ